MLCFKKILIIFFIHFLYYNLTLGKENNYIELKKIQKKLNYNEKTLKKLQTIEENLNSEIRKLNYNNNKFEYLLQKGFDEKVKLEKIIIDSEIELKENRKIISSHTFTDRKLLEMIILDTLVESKDLNTSSVLETIYKQNFFLKQDSFKEISSIKSAIKKNKLELKKINTTLANIRKKVDKSTSQIEGALGASIITAIQKEEKKIEKKYITKRVIKLKKLIESLEKKNQTKNKMNDFFSANVQDLLPVGKLSVENIRTDRLKTGILLTLKNDSLIKAPKNGLVVYADAFKGYGNMVILDLGNHYHLIFSGLTNITCATGDWVEEGSILGDISMNFEENDLYMEIRFQGKTISPSNWAKS